MTTYVESLAVSSLVQSQMIVRQSVHKKPRVKTNPDGKLHHVLSTWVQDSPLWLIVITYTKGSDRFRCRVWLRGPTKDFVPELLKIHDQQTYFTLVGAEWGAYGAIKEVVDQVVEG